MARSSLLKMMTVTDVRFYFVVVVFVAVTLCRVSFAQEIPTTTESSFSTLVQLHVINRHGARTKLSKDADDLTEEGGETLTPLGQKQLYDLGAWLRRTYGEDATSTSTTATTAFLQDYNPALHRLESSDFDRTISSANALSAGLFPWSTRSDLHGGSTDVGLLPADVLPSVPVYSRRGGNDVYLRAYSECPTFHDRLQDLYQSSRWKGLENNEQVDALLRKLGRIFAGDIETVDGAVPLKSIWNAYDEIHVALTECSASSDDGVGDGDGDGTSTTTTLTGPDSFSCKSLPNPSLATVLSTIEFAKLEDLMEDTENMKFGVETAGNLIGSNLLWKMIDRADASEGKLFLYSAHAPTIMGLLSTLQADYQADVKERFIEYGSALILEVHEEQQSSRKYIRLKYKSSLRDRAVDISLKQYSDESTVVACGNDGLKTDIDPTASLSSLSFCSLQRFIDWARTATIDSVENWCDACGNDTSDLCMDTILKKGGIVDIDNEPSSSLLTDFKDTATTDPSVIAATFAGGFLSCVLFFVIGYCFCCCRRRKVHKSADGEMIHKDHPGDDKMEAPTAHFNSDDHHETAESNGNGNDQIPNETELL